MSLPLALELVLYLALPASLVSGFSFTFTSEPQQCANLSLSISGTGTPPYSVLIIPYGPSPLQNNVEARVIVYQQFSGNSASVSFQLQYPTNSQFVAVVSDSTGFGTGGTSVAATVQSNSDSSCYNATKNVSPDFPFNISPPNQVVQCSPSRLWWTPSQVQGTVGFQAVIPGGQSFSIPTGSLSNVTDQGTGFTWTPSVRAGTTMMIVAGDGRGLGTGGSVLYNVAAGLNPNSSCLTSDSPSSTAGSPAGGSYPTSVNGGQTSGGSSSPNVGAIVGGVIGGLVLAAAVLLAGFYIIKRRSRLANKERPVDLLPGDSDELVQPPSPELRPQPFLAATPSYVPSDGSVSHYGAPSSYYGLSSHHTSTPGERSGTPVQSSSVMTPRKSPVPSALRLVTVIQHEDAGPSDDPRAEDGETIELPPAYTNITKPQP